MPPGKKRTSVGEGLGFYHCIEKGGIARRHNCKAVLGLVQKKVFLGSRKFGGQEIGV